MSDIEKNSKDFIGYEYKEITTQVNQVSMLIDGYENFGWEVDDNIPVTVGKESGPLQSSTILRLKRDRKIMNKMELTRLQRNFEFCLKEIERLEKSKTSLATMLALIVGVLGTAFMAGSVFAITADPPKVIACILLAIPGFIGWAAPYFVYRRVEDTKSREAEILIEEKRDEIFELCEKGSKLLH